MIINFFLYFSIIKGTALSGLCSYSSLTFGLTAQSSKGEATANSSFSTISAIFTQSGLTTLSGVTAQSGVSGMTANSGNCAHVSNTTSTSISGKSGSCAQCAYCGITTQSNKAALTAQGMRKK